jgi:LPS O-antigen subunit length determinant protein (WzzB/FepE family)
VYFNTDVIDSKQDLFDRMLKNSQEHINEIELDVNMRIQESSEARETFNDQIKQKLELVNQIIEGPQIQEAQEPVPPPSRNIMQDALMAENPDFAQGQTSGEL